MPEPIQPLKTIEQRLLWLSHWMIHHANHIRPKVDGIKVGGHQASSASMVSILTALYFSALDIGLTRRDFLRFLRVYFARPLRQILRDEATLLAALTREARRLQERFVRKLAAGEMT